MLLEFLHKVKASAKVTVVHIPHEDSTGQIIFTARKQSLGQGNIFTPVCHSVHRGGVPGPGGCFVPGCTCSWGVPGPWGVCLLPRGVPGPRGMPGGDPPLRTATVAGGTHPTGKHSCWIGMRSLLEDSCKKLEYYIRVTTCCVTALLILVPLTASTFTS